MIGIDNTYPTIIFDQLISLGDKYEGVTAQPVEFSENGVIDNLFDRQLDFIISPQHVSARVQELENLTISELPPLRLGFLVSRRYEERQEQELLQELPWLQMRFQNRANFEAMIDANMRPCGINPHHYLSSLQFYGQNQRRGARTFSDGDPAFCLATGESGNAEIF